MLLRNEEHGHTLIDLLCSLMDAIHHELIGVLDLVL